MGSLSREKEEAEDADSTAEGRAWGSSKTRGTCDDHGVRRAPEVTWVSGGVPLGFYMVSGT